MTEKENAAEDTIATDLVVTKYKLAGEIGNRALAAVAEKCVADASLTDICEFGDKMIEEECSKVFKKERDARKGIAFPTCISINNCVCHYSPLKSDPVIKLKNGDMCKIDLGVHIDGFMALGAHTVVVGASPTNKVKGRAADALLAAHYASEIALRLVTPGVENDTVTDAVQRVADSFKCKPISGMLSHELKQFQMDGGKTIIQNPTEAQRREHAKNDFAVHEVYAIDCLITTGDGRTRDIDSKTTIYKRTDDIYQLRMKASRVLLSDIEKKHGNMPFTLRSLENETKARMGVLECVKYRLLEPYGVLYDNPEDVIAQFKFTVLLMPSGSHKITGIPFDPSICESEHKLDEVSSEILKKSVSIKNKKKKKAEKTAGDASANAAATAGGDPAKPVQAKK